MTERREVGVEVSIRETRERISELEVQIAVITKQRDIKAQELSELLLRRDQLQEKCSGV